MSPESSVIDAAPEIDLSPSTSVDTSSADAIEESPVDGMETESDDEPEPSDPSAPNVSDGPAIVNGRPSEAMRTTLAEIAKTNPQLAKDLKRSALELDAIRKVVPGGLKEVNQLRQQMEAMGDPEAITQTRDELKYFSDLDSQFTAGDPRFVQAMIDTDEGKAGFIKLAPAMLEQYKTLAPEAHSAYVAKQEFERLRDGDYALWMNRMFDFLQSPPTDPAGVAAWQERAFVPFMELKKHYDSVNADRQKQVAPPVTKAPVQDTSERDKFQQERLQFDRTQFSTAASAEAEKVIAAELDRLTAARKLTPSQRDAVRELGVSRLRAALGKVPKFNETASKHFGKRDKDGYLRHVQSAYREIVPGVLKAAADAIVVSKGVRPAPSAVTQSGRTATSPVQINMIKPPDKSLIDFSRTDGTMIREGRAILLSGKEAKWRR